MKTKNRIHYTCIRLNEDEKSLIDEYMSRVNLGKRSTFIREAVLQYLGDFKP